MQEFLVSILLGLSAFIGVENVPSNLQQWKIHRAWASEKDTWILEASTSKINDFCLGNDVLILPQVIHGIHRVFADNKLVYQSGDSSFKTTSSFYQRGSVDCILLLGAKTVTWEVRNYSKYFSRIRDMPAGEKRNNLYLFQDVLINVMTAACLFILAIFSIYLFSGRVERQYIICLAVGSVALGIYSLLVCGNYVGIQTSMLAAHKIADVAVWIGSFCYVYFFRKFKLLGSIESKLFTFAFIIGELLIIFGNSADVVQFGTTLPIPFGFICLMSLFFHSIKNGFSVGFKKNVMLEIFSLSSFVLAACNDVFHILGIIETNMFMPVGSLFGLFFLAVAVNQDIEKTYTERDDLVTNLQSKVVEQTKNLSFALEQVKKSQAELVQSARLASLGTLSAGIAHEINNSINYVNGAVVPLERRVLKFIPDSERQIVEKLFSAIKEGTNLTVGIVRSLRNFTGMNQAPVKEVSLIETVTSVLTILKSKTNNVNLKIEVSDSLVMTCHQVGLNQIFMNLISNAVDVLPSQDGILSISAREVEDDSIEIKVSDNGHGMSPETIARIFDPFFTTKEVGKGSGLGLHIVQKEVERHHGQISVNSKLSEGTTFIITIPKNIESTIDKAAA